MVILLRHLRVRPSLTNANGCSRPHLPRPARDGVEDLSHSGSDQLLPARTTEWRIMQCTLCTNTHGSWLFLSLTVSLPTNSGWRTVLNTCSLAPMDWRLVPNTCSLASMGWRLIPNTCSLAPMGWRLIPNTCSIPGLDGLETHSKHLLPGPNGLEAHFKHLLPSLDGLETYSKHLLHGPSAGD